MLKVRAVSLVFTITLTASSSPGQTARPDSKSEILAARAAWNKAIASHDAEALSGFVAADFTEVAPPGQYWGLTAIKHLYQGLFQIRPDVAMIRTSSRAITKLSHKTR